MHWINITGYKARRRRCSSVVSWFLTKYLPRHYITVEVLHRGLRREHSYGYCSVAGDIYKPREFLIEIDPKLDLELYTKVIIHEMIHLLQWTKGTLKERRGKTYYKDKTFEDLEYWDYPHEIEAHGLEELYYHDFLYATGQNA